MIEAVTFDLDGVYFPKGKEGFFKSLGELGVSDDETRRVFLDSPEMKHQYKVGQMSDSEFWTWALDQWDLEMSPQQGIDLMINSYEADPRVVGTVKRVRQLGAKTLICSNSFPARVAGLHQKFGLLDNFDAAVFSYEAGVTKPSIEIFNTLVAKSGVEAPSIFFADDVQANVEGALAAGIKAVPYTNFDDFINQLKAEGLDL